MLREQASIQPPWPFDEIFFALAWKPLVSHEFFTKINWGEAKSMLR